MLKFFSPPLNFGHRAVFNLKNDSVVKLKTADSNGWKLESMSVALSKERGEIQDWEQVSKLSPDVKCARSINQSMLPEVWKHILPKRFWNWILTGACHSFFTSTTGRWQQGERIFEQNGTWWRRKCRYEVPLGSLIFSVFRSEPKHFKRNSTSTVARLTGVNAMSMSQLFTSFWWGGGGWQ